MAVAFRPDNVTDAAKEFLRVQAGESLTLRLIVAPFAVGSDHPSTDYEEASDPFYAPQVIPYTDWKFTTVDNAVQAVGPTCVFAFQGPALIYGFWIHRPDSPDDWLIQLLYADGLHAIPDAGGAEVVTPALTWFTGVQIPA